MARERSPNREKARQLYLASGGSMKLIDIAAELNIKDSQVRKWKSQDAWDKGTKGALPITKGSVTNRNRGGQPGNKNAVGGNSSAPPENKNAEKHGLFTKYLPAETLELVEAANAMNPLDVLWQQISIQFAAIIRSQKIMHVKDQEDKTKEVLMDGESATAYKVDQAWDKQANYLQAQSRAMTSLNGMIKTYDDLLHKNWDLATEEQRARIDRIKAGTAKLKGDDPDDEKAGDGFLGALKGEAADTWQE